MFVDELRHADGRPFVFLVGEHDEPVTVRPRLSAGRLLRLDGSPVSEPALEPFGVAVVQRA